MIAHVSTACHTLKSGAVGHAPAGIPRGNKNHNVISRLKAIYLARLLHGRFFWKEINWELRPRDGLRDQSGPFFCLFLESFFSQWVVLKCGLEPVGWGSSEATDHSLTGAFFKWPHRGACVALGARVTPIRSVTKSAGLDLFSQCICLPAGKTWRYMTVRNIPALFPIEPSSRPIYHSDHFVLCKQFIY